ncbi:MAG: ACT domain-containing protein [Acidobacteriota bacterium]
MARLPPGALPDWLGTSAFTSVTRTAAETSIVAPDRSIPAGAVAERGWAMLRVRGPIPFEQIGVLASIAGPLARASVSIFAVSTYDTDYVLVKHGDLARAIEALAADGHTITAR